MGIWSSKKPEEATLIRQEFQTQLFRLATKIGKLEHQRNEARRKHGVLKRKWKEWRERFTHATLGAEAAIAKTRILERQLALVTENARGQNDAYSKANKELRLRVQQLETDLNAARQLLIAGESARQAS